MMIIVLFFVCREMRFLVYCNLCNIV